MWGGESCCRELRPNREEKTKRIENLDEEKSPGSERNKIQHGHKRNEKHGERKMKGMEENS